MTCALCPEPAQRKLLDRVDLCMDHYQRARVRQLNAEEQGQLTAAFARRSPDGRDEPELPQGPAPVPRGGSDPEEAEVV